MKLLFALAISALFSATIVAQPALAQSSTPNGSWSDSCRNAYVRGCTFYAQCRNDGDGWVNSSINFNQCQNGAVANQNGSLVCETDGQYNNNQDDNNQNDNNQNGNSGNNRYRGNHFRNLPSGSWSMSCVGARLKNNVLRANCQTGHGYNHTSYNMNQCQSGALLNSGGNLQCDNTYQSGGNRYRKPINYSAQLPNGSWSACCRNGSMNGGVLTASCQEYNGNYHTSNINVSQCSQSVVANSNGQLICEAGQR
jgi:hypothetical protein